MFYVPDYVVLAVTSVRYRNIELFLLVRFSRVLCIYIAQKR